jgi:16S rRNA (guanine966-N2)-methyltransferase
MRISSGSAKGFTIKVPKIQDIRPAQEIVRQAVFSMLGEDVKDTQVLELYAGSGAFGLEALSHGAKHVTFVDSNPLAVAAIEENLQHARFAGRGEAIRHDAIRYLMDAHELFDLIFLAPPYAYGAPGPLLYQVGDHLANDGLIIFDHARTVAFPRDLGALEIVDQRHYGSSGVTFFRLKQPSETVIKPVDLTNLT